MHTLLGIEKMLQTNKGDNCKEDPGSVLLVFSHALAEMHFECEMRTDTYSTHRNTAFRLYSSVVERQSCKLKVLGSSPSGGYRHVSDIGNRLLECIAERQFARVAKGVDLRSTEGNFAWARTPQLTTTWNFECPCRLVVRTSRCGRDNPGSNPGKDTFFWRAGFGWQ